MASSLWSWLFPPPPSAPFRRPQRFPTPHPIFEHRHENTSYKNIPKRNLTSSNPRDWGLRNDILDRKNDGTYELAVGTRIYHGSTRGDLDLTGKHADNRMTFFGLDALISMWYVLEMSMSEEINNGYLYTFEVIRPIPVTVLSLTGYHPKNMFSPCHDLATACIRPQLAYHGTVNNSPVKDMSVEVTLHMSHFKDYLQLLSVEKVDPKMLYAFRAHRFHEFHPSHAVGENLPMAYPSPPMTELENVKGGRRRRAQKTARHRRRNRSNRRPRSRSRK